MEYFTRLRVCWLAMFQNFVSDDGYFKLKPVFDWKPVIFKLGMIWSKPGRTSDN